MGKEKDITEKILADYQDVFADIANVLLFGGKKLVQPSDLQESRVRSFYKADGKMHEQERDVFKYWSKGKVRIALVGFENQTNVDKDMVLRSIAYDGAGYRNQLRGKSKQRYPVVTMVLYFGMKRWRGPKSLKKRIKIQKELQPYVTDYHMNLFEIAYLTDEQVQMFESDFRIVADYFVQMRKNGEYVPKPETIQHVDEVLKLMSVLTGDNRFEDAQEDVKGEQVTMCEVLDKVENRGIERGIKTGMEKGIRAFVLDHVEDGTTEERIIQKLVKRFDLEEEKAREYYLRYRDEQ